MAGVLHLVLKKEWYDKVLSGEKDIEYRTLNDFWKKRILDKKDKLKKVRFTKGYVSFGYDFEITKIDVGKCPYPNWNGDFIRIHFNNYFKEG